MMKHSSKARRRAISLIEVVMFVAMTAVVAATYFTYLSGHADEAEDLRMRTQALLMAQQIVEESRSELARTALAGFPQRTVSLGGMVGVMEITPHEGSATLFDLLVSVTWKPHPGGPEHRVILSKLVRDSHLQRVPPAGRAS